MEAAQGDLSTVLPTRSKSYLNSCYLDRHSDLLGNWRPNVDTLRSCFNADDERVVCPEGAPIQFRLVLPPAGDRIDAYQSALRKVGSGPNPHVRVERSFVTCLLA